MNILQSIFPKRFSLVNLRSCYRVSRDKLAPLDRRELWAKREILANQAISLAFNFLNYFL